MKKLYTTLLTLCILAGATQLYAQKKDVWLSGTSRGIIYSDDYANKTNEDTVTARRLQSGHALVDLGVNIQPSDALLIQSELRVRNDYGGFWGSGVTFDVRQLYIQGIIGGFLKFQLGDINYKLSPYTFRNNVALINRHQGLVSSVPLEQVQYDLFYYPDNTWRQQGAAADFALEFSDVIEEMEFNAFTTRIRPTNFGSEDDRLYTGGSVVIKQGQYFNLGAQYANLYDLRGTSNNNIYLRNPVRTLSAEAMNSFGDVNVNASAELGQSTLRWINSDVAPTLEDYFYDAKVKAEYKPLGLDLTVGYRSVGPYFRSAGAQTMRINFQSGPGFYDRYGNAQSLRPVTMIDLYRDASLYNTQIQEGLMVFDPRYDNVTPYGTATPNREGVSITANYAEKGGRVEVSAEADILNEVVGEGTESTRSFLNASGMVKVGIDKIVGLTNRELWVSGRYGIQNTDRSGDADYENVDLATNYMQFNLLGTIVGGLKLIGEYRTWNSKGFELVNVRDEYSQILDFVETDIDYAEEMYGGGLQYDFSQKTKLRAMYQLFSWKDKMQGNESFEIETYTIFFTMKF